MPHISKRMIDIAILLLIHAVVLFEALVNARSAHSLLLFYWFETAIIAIYCIIRLLTGITPKVSLPDKIATFVFGIPVCLMFIVAHTANLQMLAISYQLDISAMKQNIGLPVNVKFQSLISEYGLIIPICILIGALLYEWLQTWRKSDYAYERNAYTGKDWIFEPILRIILTFVILHLSGMILELPRRVLGLTDHWATIILILFIAAVKLSIEIKWSKARSSNPLKLK